MGIADSDPLAQQKAKENITKVSVKFGYDNNPDSGKRNSALDSLQDKMKKNYKDGRNQYAHFKTMSTHTNVIFAASPGR